MLRPKNVDKARTKLKSGDEKGYYETLKKSHTLSPSGQKKYDALKNSTNIKTAAPKNKVSGSSLSRPKYVDEARTKLKAGDKVGYSETLKKGKSAASKLKTGGIVKKTVVKSKKK